MLTTNQVDLLATAGEDLSSSQFIIGDVAGEAVLQLNADHERGERTEYHRFLLLTEIGKLCGLGARRVAKLVAVALLFDSRIFELPFGYYERAFDLGKDDGELAMEFVLWYLEEYNRLLGINEFVSVFRPTILGTNIIEFNPPEEEDVVGLVIRNLARCRPFVGYEIQQLIDRLSELLEVVPRTSSTSSPVYSGGIEVGTKYP